MTHPAPSDPAPSGSSPSGSSPAGSSPADPEETRRRRLRIRAWRRGTREMDLILGGFADARLAGMDAATLDAFETLLDEADPDLYAWIAGQAAAPAALRPMLEAVAAHVARHVAGRPAGA